LVFYLCRYYDPSSQRWSNRDPLQELGGINLYRAFNNDSGSYVDPWGLADAVLNTNVMNQIASNALFHVGATNFAFYNPYGYYIPGLYFGQGNKCNLFGAVMARGGGASVPNIGGLGWFHPKGPPSAAQWGNSGSTIPGWTTIPISVPGALGSGGIHMGVSTGSNSVSATSSGVTNNNWSFRPPGQFGASNSVVWWGYTGATMNPVLCNCHTNKGK